MEKHYLLVAFLLILAGWLPYILIFWPGSVPYDGFRQLNMFAGNQRFTNKHPWELSLIMGALMTIGNVISDNWGIFMVVGVLALIYAVCYATVCYKLKSWGAPMMGSISAVLHFSVLCLYLGAYSQTIIKDGSFMRSVFPFHGNLCGMLHSHPSGKKWSVFKTAADSAVSGWLWHVHYQK